MMALLVENNAASAAAASASAAAAAAAAAAIKQCGQNIINSNAFIRIIVVSENCRHAPVVCANCVAQHIDTSLNGKVFSEVRSPHRSRRLVAVQQAVSARMVLKCCCS